MSEPQRRVLAQAREAPHRSLAAAGALRERASVEQAQVGAGRDGAHGSCDPVALGDLANDPRGIADRDDADRQVAHHHRAGPDPASAPMVTPGQTMTPPPARRGSRSRSARPSRAALGGVHRVGRGEELDLGAAASSQPSEIGATSSITQSALAKVRSPMRCRSRSRSGRAGMRSTPSPTLPSSSRSSALCSSRSACASRCSGPAAARRAPGGQQLRVVGAIELAAQHALSHRAHGVECRPARGVR